MLSAQTLHIAINRPCDEVYAFLSRPENFPLWAKGLANSLRQEDEGWVADTPQGKLRIRFSAPNAFGVLDHWVTLPNGSVVYVPLRTLANRHGTEVIFTLFRQPEMDDAMFARDAGLVNADLQALKRLLESR
ncbi:SRPBCC family protein [Serratia sp. Lou2A]|uniref:SRPBCC family protein n=1 Tax=Serratia montpellierensis TaxID=2598730 RepID=A0ABS8J2D1_9GAMM|nr:MULTISPECIES: SRPBCC family protein [unclassified Serratia (in: enterobacteria)]MCC7584216.1 SRPBCC family protein [Serratia sp. Lou2A]MCC7658151.1 SRPBCC family protein [Serratia sp. Pon4B]